MSDSQSQHTRWVAATVKEICERKGIPFSSYSDNWVLAVGNHKIYATRFGINDDAAAHIADDKVATYEVLFSNTIPALPHYLPTSKNVQDLEGQVVVKPLFGKQGIDIHLVSSYPEASSLIRSRPDTIWTASPFVDIKREIRLIILDGKVLLSYEKQSVMVDGLAMFNLHHGAQIKDAEPSGEIKELAIKAASTIGLRLSAVDVIELKTGEYMVIEVNVGISMHYYVRSSQEHEKKAYEVYGAIIDALAQ